MENNTSNYSSGEIVIYQTSDGSTSIDVRVKNDTVWLTQNQLATLFQRDKSVIPADRLTPRLRLKDSLDQIFAEKCPHVIDTVESKFFAIGVESYTTGPRPGRRRRDVPS